jgi:hypothetical protein
MAQAQCAKLLGPPTYLPVAGPSASTAVGDFNRDGRPDLVASTNIFHGATFLGNGDGTFGAATSVPFGCCFGRVVAADFNGDTNPDIAFAGSGATSVAIYPGRGDGTFEPALLSSGGGSNLTFLAGGEFNGDGAPDLVVQQGGGFFVLPARGDGTFNAPLDCLVGGSSLAVADLNADGRLDLATADNVLARVSLGLGNGTFQQPVGYAAGGSNAGIAVGDLNGDSFPDMAVANQSQGRVAVLLGNGNGTFQAARSFAAGENASFIAIGDFSGDAAPDIAVGRSTTTADTGGVSVLAGNGDGTFQPPLFYLSGANVRMITVGDFNIDGRADMAVTNQSSPAVAVLLGLVGPAIVTQQPSRATTVEGGSIAFSTSVAGPDPITYRWRKDGVPLWDGPFTSGAASPVLLLTGVPLADNGAAFDCEVTNSCGANRSNAAGLIVAPRCLADFNRSGGPPSVQDIFDFLAAYFAGCP